MDAQIAHLRRFAVACIALLAMSCGPTLAGYSLESYRNATSLKAEVAALVEESSEPFASHETEVREISVRIDAAYEFAAAMPNNHLSAAQWEMVRSEALFGGFVATWRSQGTTSVTYREQKKGQLNRAFDQISCLEVNKKELKTCSGMGAAR